MTVVEDFASTLARLQADSLSDDLRAKLKLHVVDVIGAWIAGSATGEGAKLIAFRDRTRRQGGGGNLPLDVATNCAFARLSEVDDIHLASMTTPGSIVVPGALTIAMAQPDAPTSELLTAIIAGYEAMIRLGLALDGPHNLYRGIWPTYIAAPFGIAAVAARLMGLDPGQTAHALALALIQAAPGVGHHNAATTSRWFAVGNAVRNGLTAVQAAQAGFTSDLKLLESGFFTNVYGITPDAVAFARDSESVLAQLSFKPWCAARQTMAATQALRELMRDGAKPDVMQDIRVAVPPPHLRMIDHGVVAGDRASHLTSVQYQMAMAAFRPDAVYDVGQSPGSLPPEMTAFMGRIAALGDDALLAEYPAVWPAHVSLTTSAGTVERTVTHVPGDPARPFDSAAVMEKFCRVTAPVMTPERADALARRIVDGLNGPKFSFDWSEIRSAG